LPLKGNTIATFLLYTRSRNTYRKGDNSSKLKLSQTEYTESTH